MQIKRRNGYFTLSKEQQQQRQDRIARSLIYLVYDHEKIKFSEIKSRARRREISECRQIAMYFLRKHTKLSSSKIGAYFNRDHATVLNSVKQVNNHVLTERDYANKIEDINTLLLNELSL